MLLLPTTASLYEGVILCLAFVALSYCSLRFFGFSRKNNISASEEDADAEGRYIYLQPQPESFTKDRPVAKVQSAHGLYPFITAIIGTLIYFWLISRPFFFGPETLCFSLAYILLIVVAIKQNRFPKIVRWLLNAAYSLLILAAGLLAIVVPFVNTIQDRMFIAGSVYCIHTNSDMLMKMTEVRLVRYTFQGSETIASETFDGYSHLRIEASGESVRMVPN